MSNVKLQHDEFMAQDDQAKKDIKLVKTSEFADYEMAHRGLRTVAFLIDGIFLGIMQNLVQVATVFMATKFLHLQASQYTVPILILNMTLAFFYWIYCGKNLGGTLGKKMLGLRIVSSDNTLELSYKQLILRETLGKMLSGLVFGIGYLRAYFVKDKKTWHDLVSKTMVIKFRN